MSKLNPNAQKWVDALRSGQYKQGKRQLRNGDYFCCLGVACDLYAQSHKNVKWNGNRFLGKGGWLPYPVRQWLRIKDDCGNFGHDALTQMNDRGFKFSTIARTIEKHAEELGVSA